MTLTEQVEDALSRGRLNLHDMQRIIPLMEHRILCDSTERIEELQRYTNKVLEILNHADLSASERLTKASER